MMNEREMQKRVEQIRMAELASAQAAATERVPHARAELADAAALFERNIADACEATRAREAADAAVRVAMAEAVSKPIEEAVKSCSRKREAQRAAVHFEEVALHRADVARGMRAALRARLVETEAVARGYDLHLAKRAREWVERSDLKGLVRRGALDRADADAVRRIAAGEPVLDGQRVFAQFATKIFDAEHS